MEIIAELTICLFIGMLTCFCVGLPFRLLIRRFNLNKYGKYLALASLVIGALVTVTYFQHSYRYIVRSQIEKFNTSKELYDWAVSDVGLKEVERTNLLRLIVNKNTNLVRLQSNWEICKSMLGEELAKGLYGIQIIQLK